MNRGRKEQDFTPKRCRKVDSFISSNQTELMDATRENSLALFPAFTEQNRKRITRRDLCPVPLPLDLLIEILIRLPPNSLTRFKCVSTQWSSLISCRHFCHRLFTITRQHQPHLYMCLVDKLGKRILLSISSTSPNNTSLVVDQDLSISGMGGFFLNSLNALLCFQVRKKARIYNPTTSQHLTLPAIQSHLLAEQGLTKNTRYYIGHDPVADQYKLLCTIALSSSFFQHVKSEHWVFVLEAGGSWKKLVPLQPYHPHAPSTVGQFINGPVVHYLAWLNVSTCAVVSFDTRSEDLTTTLVPPEAGDMCQPAGYLRAGLIEHAGKIALLDHSRLKDKGVVDLWIMDKAKRKGWSQKRWHVKACQRHLVRGIDFILRGTTPDGKVILLPLKMRYQFYVLFYDMQSNDLSKVEIKGVPHLWFHKKCYFGLKYMDENDSFIFFET